MYIQIIIVFVYRESCQINLVLNELIDVWT